ncbi:NAD(P)/FAD-dependent oxidoreductase [Luteibaculum oceani]|uniref:NAD(P)/FAD-dependent oxidoreductase n=1 Tax=Luteibaculum oceani TaxID=1294296 RepID=A0A5C6UY62_9FLAO|nr:FAD/NAD(P)-binding oxidoreductase [Luteibaculum oceani]TXC76996.1 NAD(P)/FAD-dependent oxidoreductase [Luteibaculum oceani]
MDYVIIGNGIAGITTARHIRKRDSEANITVISKESKYFFSRTALMYIYMGHMRFEHTKPYEDFFWEKNNINLIQAEVTNIDFSTQELTLKGHSNVYYDYLVLATGSKPNKFGWPGQDLEGVGTLYSLQDLEYLEQISAGVSKAVVVGGGLIGVELVEMLRSRDIEVYFVIREGHFWGSVLSAEESEMLNSHFKNDHHVHLKFNSNLEEIIPDDQGKVKSIRIKETGEQIDCEFVGLTAGVSPNVDFLRETELEIDKGILVDEFLKTNINNVYAVGDCVQLKNPPQGRRATEAVWYVGRMMGETLAKTLCGLPTKYSPGPWFNSAKFMDIEYQTYGLISANPQEGESYFYWQHPTEYIALRIAFETDTKKLLGVNSFGFRLRHEMLDAWLREKVSVEEFLAQLKNANFDPEFYDHFEEDIVSAFNLQFGTNIKTKKKSWLQIFQTGNS